MHHDHADAVLPQLGKHIGHRERGEILELVEIAVERPAARCIGFLPAECGKTDRRDEKTAEKGRGVLANLPLGEVHQKDFAFVHDSADVDRLLGCSEDPVERGVRQERADLILNRSNSVGAHSVRVFFILMFPERTHLGVFDVADDLFAKWLIRK
jgi:hypothetical protein